MHRLQQCLSAVTKFRWRRSDEWTAPLRKLEGIRLVQVAAHGCYTWKPCSHLTCVLCLRGTTWVTMEGDMRDFVLRPGESLTLRGRGLAALQALCLADAQCAINESIQLAAWTTAEALNEQERIPRK